ncbi:MAG: phytoene/squalene synthase family protein [Dysgonamonadaceae bacterium]|nr:phytoene/squalene synthase family protein [Dysgonamonadaceae bacterium]
MTNIDFFKQTCYRISELITKKYSTSFSLAVSLLEKEERKAIYAIYGFVRLADEIVDSFDGFDKEFLLEKLKSDLDYALLNGISTNPVILAFVDTVKKYRIEKKFIDAFIRSMEYDLYKTNYKTQHELEQYIYGSAEVVGLMCLKVFCKEDENLFSELVPYAKSLGSAFQKVNFLRDINADMNKLGRIYFPEIHSSTFDEKNKQTIIDSIEKDFEHAKKGIKKLPGKAKLAVSLAYHYYRSLLNKIKKVPVSEILSRRIRVPDLQKIAIFLKVYILNIFF